MKFLGIIPARYGSTRLEGKPLMDINGKSMIQRVYEKAAGSFESLFVATDDQRIIDEVKRFGGEAITTSVRHNSGTNRCLEAYENISKNLNLHFDVVVNVQGDEPLLDPEQIQILKDCFTDENTIMATLATPVTDPGDLQNESEVFVVFDKNHNALYFSRSVIPYLKGINKSIWSEKYTYFKHVGLYAYTPEALKTFSGLHPSKLEITEGLEQNRWIENGHAIKVGITDHTTVCVDTPEDLERVRNIIQKMEN